VICCVAFHPRVSSAMAALLLILVGTTAAALDTTGVGAIRGADSH
jgi:hypothetical protein